MTVLTPWPGVPDDGDGTGRGTRAGARRAAPGDHGEVGDLEIALPAEARQLFVVRSVVSGIAANEGFDLDDTADLRMATDELASTLLLLAPRGSTLNCAFTLAGDGTLTVRANVPVDAGVTADTSTFSWHVLGAATDSTRTWTTSHPSDAAAELLHIEVTKRPGRRDPTDAGIDGRQGSAG